MRGMVRSRRRWRSVVWGEVGVVPDEGSAGGSRDGPGAGAGAAAGVVSGCCAAGCGCLLVGVSFALDRVLGGISCQ